MENRRVNQNINNNVNEQVRKLESLFPSVVKDGEVDFEALKEELGQFTEVGSEKYELTWAGKKNAKRIAQEDVVGRTLKFIPEDSKDADTTENLYIEGDNLEVLKLLRQNYYGAIKMIYIDPPYNTGNDFVYNDSFFMDKEDSDFAEGDIDSLGERYIVNKDSQNRFHANWLNMMYARLVIAKDLLAEDGVICISIGENENTNISKICDEIFGEKSLVADMIWQKKTGASDAVNIACITEHIFVYAKNVQNVKFKQNEEAHDENRYRYKDEYYDVRGPFYYDNLDRGTLGYHESLDYGIEAPDGTLIYPNDRTEKHNDGWRWKWSKDKLEWGIENGYISVMKANTSSGWKVYYKIYLNVDNEGNVKKRTSPYKNIISGILNTHAANEAKKIFSTTTLFSNPKPVDLILFLMDLQDDDGAIYMDFFAGSSTTAHAVMKLNATDNGNRKFVLVQLPEKCEEKSDAYKSGYKNICEIGKERIRRAGDMIRRENPKVDIDIGFKVFRVADTNIKWNFLMDKGQLDVAQMEYNPDLSDFMPNANDIDIVYELMLRQRDVALSEPLERLPAIGNRTYLYASSFLVCLETEITEELTSKLAELDPLPIKFIFRDSAFKDDIELKDETFRRLKALVEKNAGISKPTYTVEFI
ncbi:MAG: site-specific DNA-methyltransferase [Roseburia sp.]|nr:site-specific DNA-methyltransferase [Roseburia sp.]MCM1279278.1 site-specific DNA-methyltransferase [Robinsoniella sp.]